MKKQEMSGFVKFILLVLSVMFAIAMAMAIVLATAPRKAHAERQMTLKNGILTVMVDVLKIQNIPREITNPETAFKLYSGQLRETTVTNQGKTTRHFSFPWVKVQTTHVENLVAYRNGKWFVDPPLLRPVERNDYFLSACVWGPVIIFMVVGIVLIVVSVRALKESGEKLTAQIMPDRTEQVDRG